MSITLCRTLSFLKEIWCHDRCTPTLLWTPNWIFFCSTRDALSIWLHSKNRARILRFFVSSFLRFSWFSLEFCKVIYLFIPLPLSTREIRRSLPWNIRKLPGKMATSDRAQMLKSEIPCVVSSYNHTDIPACLAERLCSLVSPFRMQNPGESPAR